MTYNGAAFSERRFLYYSMSVRFNDPRFRIPMFAIFDFACQDREGGIVLLYIYSFGQKREKFHQVEETFLINRAGF